MLRAEKSESPKRVKFLNDKKTSDGDFILYWMQSSQRVENNWALSYAIEEANNLGLPVIVYFGLVPEFPEANYRHYWFMLEGLKEVKIALEKIGVSLVIKQGSPPLGLIDLSKKASQIFVDRGYLKVNKSWYNIAAERIEIPLIQVEDNVVVPVEETSQKEEYSAATFRPKLLSKLNQFLDLPSQILPKKSSIDLEFDSLSLFNLEKTLGDLAVDRSVNKSKYFQGGTTRAKKMLELFIEYSLELYEREGNTPENNCASYLSPYLHFGQISPVYIALQILRTNAAISHKFLEQLIIRRELATNFVHYNPNYDSFLGLPQWAKKTLATHAGDQRSYSYSLEELESGRTHDTYWNAAQMEMVATGKMNGYMRMYWGKKIIEWSRSPSEAFKTALFLNNKYELDGRDPNGYAGVAWCFGKHDRPWKERAIFGMVRFMNMKGLERKFNMQSYLQRAKSSYTR
jgi:deoxyribodipyrimidine photo-lyase